MPGRDDEDVSVPQDMIGVRAPAAIAVRNRIALKENSGPGRERGNGLRIGCHREESCGHGHNHEQGNANSRQTIRDDGISE